MARFSPSIPSKIWEIAITVVRSLMQSVSRYLVWSTDQGKLRMGELDPIYYHGESPARLAKRAENDNALTQYLAQAPLIHGYPMSNEQLYFKRCICLAKSSVYESMSAIFNCKYGEILLGNDDVIFPGKLRLFLFGMLLVETVKVMSPYHRLYNFETLPSDILQFISENLENTSTIRLRIAEGHPSEVDYMNGYFASYGCPTHQRILAHIKQMLADSLLQQTLEQRRDMRKTLKDVDSSQRW